jgi:hypothetical protein
MFIPRNSATGVSLPTIPICTVIYTSKSQKFFRRGGKIVVSVNVESYDAQPGRFSWRIAMGAKWNWDHVFFSCVDGGKRSRRHWKLLSAGCVLAVAVGFALSGSRRASAAPPLPADKVEVPRFVVDPSWPHIPNGWTLGQVSSAAADADGNI